MLFTSMAKMTLAGGSLLVSEDTQLKTDRLGFLWAEGAPQKGERGAQEEGESLAQVGGDKCGGVGHSRGQLW